MGRFRTREGWCVVEHGEIRLESLGVRERVGRGLKNAKRSHERRYERGVLRFVGVVLLGALSVGQLVYRALFGDWRLLLLGVGIVVVVFGMAYAVHVLRRFVRRRFRGYTDDRTIPLRAVASVEPRQKRPLRAPHIVVRYREYGDAKKRRIGVCTRTPLAADEFETAKALLLDDHDLPITPA
ncbi:hypothetical protein [Halococcus hamelinensis]|uniref:Uncharacterized protein n=1 Tax=Halococcus hamelinensis 100A6 TaxID=1132509 RepID=M0M8P1_9EURY|nr:hypothetical protein [Halococcus hamelinensis]EMA40974.1 hypothetical protein C447_03084 [Halococcus hamelinensis 100A6]